MRHDISISLDQIDSEDDDRVKVRITNEETRGLEENDPVFLHDVNDDYHVFKGSVFNISHQPDFSVLTIAKSSDPYYVDGHMHLEYGELTEEYALKFIEEGIRKGLDEVDILDHTHRFVEFRECYRHLRIFPQQDKWLNGPGKFRSTLDEYDRLISKIRKMQLPIRVRFGLEVCYSTDTQDLLKDILKDRHYDFLTGAVHSISHQLYDMSFSDELLWKQFKADDIYREYYRTLMACVSSGLFDRLAHPDTIKVANIYPDYDLSETYQQLCQLLKKYNVTAENNTGCHYRYGHPDIGLSDQLLKAFQDNGVKIITASDAHKPEHVGSYIKEATERGRL